MQHYLYSKRMVQNCGFKLLGLDFRSFMAHNSWITTSV